MDFAGYQSLNITLLIISFIVLAIAMIPNAQKTVIKLRSEKYLDQHLPDTSQKYHFILVGFLLLIAAAVRIWQIGNVPEGINQDEAMACIEANAIASYGTDRFGMFLPVHFTAWEYGQMSALLTYLLVPFVKIFGLNPIAIRMPLLIISLLSLFVLYKLTKGIWNRNVALFVLAFAAINPWQIMQSRWSIDCNLFPHIFLFAVYFLWLGFRKKGYAYLSMFFFALCMYCYGISFYTVPVFLIFMCIYILRKKILNWKQAFLCVGIYFLFAWPIYTMMLLNFFKQPTISTPFFTIPFFPESVRTNDLLFFSPQPLYQLFFNFKSFMKTILLQLPDMKWNTLPEFGTLYLFSMPFTITGFIITAKRFFFQKEKEKNAAQQYGSALILMFFAVGVEAGLLTNQVNVNRINVIFYSLIIFTALGIYEICRRVKLFTMILAAIYAISFCSFSYKYFTSCYPFFPGFGESLHMAEKYDYDTIYITSHIHADYENAQVSEILTLFHHSIDAKYLQGVKSITDSKGNSLLPYHERYQYVDFSSFPIDENKNAVYIVNNEEVKLFDSELFTIHMFEKYSIVIPNKIVQTVPVK